MKRFGRFVLDFIVCCFLAIVAVAILIVVVSNRDVDGTAEILGHQLRVVTSDSMGECELTDVSQYEIKSIPVKSLIVIKTMPDDEAEAQDWYRSIKVGDVLTFRYVYGTQITITHRVASITEKEGGVIIELAGDNVNAKDNQLYQTIDTSIPNNPNYVVGKVVWTAKWAGQLLTAIRNPIGLIFLIWIPCVIITVMQVYEIGTATGTSKRRRALRKARALQAPVPKGNVDVDFIRYIDRQYEKANERSWNKYAKQFKHRKAIEPTPLYTGKGIRAKHAWKKYANQYQNQTDPQNIPRINSGLGTSSTPGEWKGYAKTYQDQERSVPMPRFQGRDGREKK